MSIIGGDDNDTLITEFDKDVDPQVPKRRGRQPYPRDAAGNIIRLEAPAAAVEEEAAAPATEAEQEEDIRPKRAHTLFRKPMKKDE
jgi:hypothetical protein